MIRKYNNFYSKVLIILNLLKQYYQKLYERLEIKYLNRGTNGLPSHW